MGNIIGCQCLKKKEEEDKNYSKDDETEQEPKKEHKGPDSLINVKISTSNFVRKRTQKFEEVYEVIKYLGQGAFGSVYSVKAKEGNEIRAMKQITKENLLDPSDAESIKNEIKVLKKLDHPNIIKIYEFFEDKDNLYIINEFLNGGDLGDKMEKYGTICEFMVKYIMYHVLFGVNYLHECRVLHGDIKRENVLCSIDKTDDKQLIDVFEILGKKKRIGGELKSAKNISDLSTEASEIISALRNYEFKLIDFGSAKMKRKHEINKKLSGIIGTAYYCSPEVVDNQYSFECDEWSCGILMYILLTGVPPFLGETEEEIFVNIKTNEPEFNCIELKGVSENCKSLMKKLLEKDPKKRITAKDALSEKFFSEGIAIKDILKTNLSFKSQENILKKMILRQSQIWKRKSSGKTSVFKESVIGYIALSFSDKQKEAKIKNIFRELANNDPGFIITKETFIEQIKKNLALEDTTELGEIFDSIDDNKNGQIDFQELVRSLYNEKDILTEKNVENAFKFFDIDGNGEISWDEIADVVFKGKKVKDSVMDEFFKEIGEDKRNKGITLNEFKEMFVYKDEEEEVASIEEKNIS